MIMAEILKLILQLIKKGEVSVSDHGYDELSSDGLTAREVVASVNDAVIIEEYP